MSDLTFNEIQNAQQIGGTYANDNQTIIFQEGMTPETFAAAALENYNANSEANGEDRLPTEQETDFLFGARRSFPEQD